MKTSTRRFAHSLRRVVASRLYQRTGHRSPELTPFASRGAFASQERLTRRTWFRRARASERQPQRRPSRVAVNPTAPDVVRMSSCGWFASAA